MSSQDLATLVAAIVGGVLAIVGGFVGTLFSQKLARDEEKRTVLREKTEEIYKLLNQVENWSLLQEASIKDLKGGAGGGTGGSELQSDSPIADVVMLTRLYIHSLISSVEDLHLSVIEMESLCDKINQNIKNGNPVSDEKWREAAHLNEVIAKGCKALCSSLENLIQY